MNKRFASKALAWILAMLFLLSLTACGGQSRKNSFDTSTQVERAPDMPGEGYEAEAESPDVASEQVLGLTIDEKLDADRKVAYTTHMGIQTLEYESALAKIEKIIGEQKLIVDARSEHQGRAGGLRSLEVTLLLPKKVAATTLQQLRGTGSVQYEEQQREDLTLSYSDQEERLKSLRNQQKRLNELYKEAKEIDDLLTIERRLSEISYEIERVESSKRLMDQRVDYHTLYLSLTEQRQIQPKIDPNLSYREQFMKKLQSGYDDFLYWLSDIGLELADNAFYIAFWLGAILVLWLLWRLLRWPARRRKKKAKQLEMSAQAAASKALEDQTLAIKEQTEALSQAKEQTELNQECLVLAVQEMTKTLEKGLHEQTERLLQVQGGASSLSTGSAVPGATVQPAPLAAPVVPLAADEAPIVPLQTLAERPPRYIHSSLLSR